MDYVEVFKNLKTNNKWGRKSPHKAVLMLAVIELFEKNILTDNEIYYDETLKSTFLNVWNRVLPDEKLFHPEAYLPFWYLQGDSFWHIIPIRGKEDILSLMRDNGIKPSETKLSDSVKYAELDEDLFFLMTLPSGRSSLKRVLLEDYFTLSRQEIEKLIEKKDSTIENFSNALSDFERTMPKDKKEQKNFTTEVEDGLVGQFSRLEEDVQLSLNIAYFTFLKEHKNERELIKELCPTVYDLLDKIINHPIKQGELTPSFAFVYDIFLSDLKVSLLSEDSSIEFIDKIGEAIAILRGDNAGKKDVSIEVENQPKQPIDFSVKKEQVYKEYADKSEIEHEKSDNRGNDIKTKAESLHGQVDSTESRRGKAWTEDEERLLMQYYQEGKEFITIASLMNRSELAIKLRLSKLGLFVYKYGQEDIPLDQAIKETRSQTDESEFTIENSYGRATIYDKYGERVYTIDGQLKYLNKKLYRLNLKSECFTLKGMFFDGSEWKKGTKIIVAYRKSDLYSIILNSTDYCEEVEDIVVSSILENCKLKVRGIWFNYEGKTILDTPAKKEIADYYTSLNSDVSERKSPVYADRRQTILQAKDHFRNGESAEGSIILTREIIEAARTPNGGFTKSQLAAIGIEWPAPTDWIERKIGTKITESQLERFNHIEYVPKQVNFASFKSGEKTYRDVAFNETDRKQMEAVLDAISHFYSPATPRDIARTVSRSAWGSDVKEESVDSILKRMPEVEYVKWGKYILKSRKKMDDDVSGT